jgi:hypothetical protein
VPVRSTLPRFVLLSGDRVVLREERFDAIPDIDGILGL